MTLKCDHVTLKCDHMMSCDLLYLWKMGMSLVGLSFSCTNVTTCSMVLNASDCGEMEREGGR